MRAFTKRAAIAVVMLHVLLALPAGAGAGLRLPQRPDVAIVPSTSQAPELTARALDVQAQQSGAPCLSAEIVFLVDQSASMGGRNVGSTSHPEPNDPLNLRFFGPLYAMRTIGGEYLNLRNIPGQKRVGFSMAVVNFGDHAEVGLNWRTLTPSDPQSWDATKADLEKQLDAGDLATTSMGSTNPLSAFEEAVRLFRVRGPVQSGCPRRAVVLLTDGKPNVEGVTVDQHMASIQELVNQQMPAPDYQIFVTAINDADPQEWREVEQKWKDISGDQPGQTNPRTQLVSQPDELSSRLSNVFAELATNTVPEPIQPNFLMPPYQQEARFEFFKRYDPDAEHLLIFDESGRQVTPDRTDIEVEVRGTNEPTETVIVRTPAPGRWRYQTTANRSDVLVNLSKIRAGAVLKSPAGTSGLENSALQFVRTQIEFQLVGGDNKPLPEYTDPKYSLQITATVQSGVRSVPVTMRRTSQQTYVTDFIPIEAGEHRLSVLGITRDLDDNPLEVINGQVGSFQVGPVAMQSVGDTGGSEARCGQPQQGDTMHVAYAFKTADGKNIVSDIPVRWNVTGQAGGDTWEVPVVGPDTSGIYSGTFTTRVSGPNLVLIRATVLEPATGQEHDVLSDELRFDAAPTQLLAFDLTQPAANTTTFTGRKLGLQWLPPFFTAESPPMNIDAKLVTVATSDSGTQTSGAEVNPSTVATSDPGSLLGVTVKDVIGGSKVGQVDGLRWTGKGGEYSASISGLAPGRYQLLIQAGGEAELRCGFGWAAGGLSSNIREFEVIEDPLLGFVWTPFALLLLATAVLASGFLIGRIYAPQGSLLILQTNGQPLLGASYPLGPRLFNRKRVIKEKDIPAAVGVSRIEAWTRREWFRSNARGQSAQGPGGQQQARPRRVMVKIYPKDGNPWKETELQQSGLVQLPRQHRLSYRDR